jgi:tRNA pseudouridine55 synthase
MNGFILVNKESGVSSNFIVQHIKKKIKAKKVGHLGTLDPLASGLLILAINRATKFSSYFLESDKSYDVEVELGASTDTDDSTGKIIYESNNFPVKSSIKNELESFLGESMQVPPFFSALKYKGKPLYKYAREGELIAKPPRKILVTRIESIDFDGKTCSFKIYCSKGTYIRSIARDLGERLGCGAHMKSLIRISQGDFNVTNAKSASDIIEEDIISIEDAFKNLEKIKIQHNDEKKFINGVTIPNFNFQDAQYRIFNKNNNFVGIGEIIKNNLKHKQLV